MNVEVEVEEVEVVLLGVHKGGTSSRSRLTSALTFEELRRRTGGERARRPWAMRRSVPRASCRARRPIRERRWTLIVFGCPLG